MILCKFVGKIGEDVADKICFAEEKPGFIKSGKLGNRNGFHQLSVWKGYCPINCLSCSWSVLLTLTQVCKGLDKISFLHSLDHSAVSGIQRPDFRLIMVKHKNRPGRGT